MTLRNALVAILLFEALWLPGWKTSSAAEPAPAAQGTKKVYGEWRILIKPDKGDEYNALIKSRGMPLFKQAGGRMVGWWKTLIGNLYEQVTIWEYDDMAAFERAIGFLGHNKRFAEFVALRDPLLTGEQNRFLTLAANAEQPLLSDPAHFVVHEIHRVPQARLGDYLHFMTDRGLKLLKEHGFRPSGPWTVEVGDWSEVTYLFRFNSLDERSRLIAQFSDHADAKEYGEAIHKFTDGITTRMLVPAPFAAHPQPVAAAGPISSSLLPHVERLADGVYSAGFSARFGSANCGWFRSGDRTVLVDLPRGIDVSEFLAEVNRIAGKPVRTLVLTNAENGDERILETLAAQGVGEIIASPKTRERLLSMQKGPKPSPVETFAASRPIGDADIPVTFLSLDDVFSNGGAALHLPLQQVLFVGPLVCNGPRTRLPGSDTERWVSMLGQFEELHPVRVVPGFGSWGGPQTIAREKRFLAEMRREVAYLVCQGRPESALAKEVRIPAVDLVWMPYDTPTLEDLEHVYHELTVPLAPFHGRSPAPDDPRPHALVLIGDQPHEPGHIVEGLAPVFAATGVVPHFAVDVRALSKENLAKVKLLVILRDGLQRPTDDSASNYAWMTMQQQEAVERFVTEGGGFLNLHNSMGLYPENGPYLKLVGGRYIGHGPLERFRVEVVDAEHPITRGIEGFSVADEQHTPPYDQNRVHLLLRNRSDDGKVVAAAGWVYEPGRGRLCHLANGHTREALLHPTYQQLMQNAVNWCLRRDSKRPL